MSTHSQNDEHEDPYAATDVRNVSTSRSHRRLYSGMTQRTGKPLRPVVKKSTPRAIQLFFCQILD